MIGLTAVEPEGSELTELRLRVRAFLATERETGGYVPEADAWMSGISPEFSRKLAAQGWVGMTIPTEHGGHGRSALERYVVNEELLAGGAPVAAHWIADRQMAPGILRNGTAEQKRRYLPGIVAAERFFGIGMSEPDAGSDLASVRTRAVRTDGGWRLTGTKLWTSSAHVATTMVVLARTDPDAERHAGLSQFIVDLPHPDVHISPIVTIDGGHHFNEVFFDDAVIDEGSLLGGLGEGWRQVTAELGNERSGPERLLSTLPVLMVWAERLRGSDDVDTRRELGRLTGRLAVLRQLSWAVADRLDRGEDPALEAALVKDLGTLFESEIIESVRRHHRVPALGTGHDPFDSLLAKAVLHSPAFTLRGGTNEVLRSIVAKGLKAR